MKKEVVMMITMMMTVMMMVMIMMDNDTILRANIVY